MENHNAGVICSRRDNILTSGCDHAKTVLKIFVLENLWAQAVF